MPPFNCAADACTRFCPNGYQRTKRTVALCGGRLDDLHLWLLDAVDIRTAWTEQRALENRSQHCTLAQIADLEASLPFRLLGVDSDNGGEFINHHLVAYLV